jgi:NAD(P)-dependent dehydrogenase (short-subunit alcohol dehydrogenase family)
MNADPRPPLPGYVRPFPPRHRPPDGEHESYPEPEIIREGYVGSERLAGQNVLITGGDSGIGRAVAVHFAAEGAAAVGIVYLDEQRDAEKTAALVEAYGATCVPIPCDLGDPECAEEALAVFRSAAGRKIHLLVNNAAAHWPSGGPETASLAQLDDTFRKSVYSYFLFTQAALPHMPDGGAIVNTAAPTPHDTGLGEADAFASVRGAAKGAIVAFTRSLAAQLANRRIRVNCVAPGPIWTAAAPAPVGLEHLAKLGEITLLKRAGQPSEVAPCYVFLASADGSYMTGQVLRPNGGEPFRGLTPG